MTHIELSRPRDFRNCASILGLIAAISVAGCDANTDAVVTATATATSSLKPAASTSAKAAPPADPFKVDAEVVKLVKAIATGCSVGDNGWVRDCKAGEEEALFAYARKDKPETFYGTLAEIAITDGKSDKKVYQIATHEIGFLPDGMDDWLKKNGSPAATERLMKVLAVITPDQASRVATGAVAVILAGGQRATLTPALDARPENDGVRKSATMYYARYGGAEAFPDLERWTTAKDESLRYSAAWSIGVAMPTPFSPRTISDDVKSGLCDFAKKLSASGDEAVMAGATESLGRCGGAYLDVALDALDKRASASEPPKRVATAAFHQCWGEGIVGRAPNGSKEQCARVISILEKVATHEGTPTEELRVAIWAAGSVATTMPDLKPKAQALRDKFKSHKEKQIADEANRPIK